MFKIKKNNGNIMPYLNSLTEIFKMSLNNNSLLSEEVNLHD